MKCASFDAVNEHNDSNQIENKNGIISCQLYYQNIEHYELCRFLNLQHDINIIPVLLIPETGDQESLENDGLEMSFNSTMTQKSRRKHGQTALYTDGPESKEMVEMRSSRVRG
jgi:hypothetical protein